MLNSADTEYLPFVEIGTTSGINRNYLPSYDDSISDSISVPVGFAFGNATHAQLRVSQGPFIHYQQAVTE